MSRILRTWSLRNFDALGSVDLSLYLYEQVPPKSLLLAVSANEHEEFLSVNPGWKYSSSVELPFRYVPEVTDVPGVVRVGEIALPPGSSELALSCIQWRPVVESSDAQVGALLLSTSLAGGASKIRIIEGTR